jgi:demethylmenaquinone methyltransferase/2-methoxy-6-polyprenyl-1,4-benzoquinol methylase
MDREGATGRSSSTRGRLVDRPLAEVAASFDARAGRYDEDAFHRWLSMRVADRTTPLGGRLLDVGAGTGLASSRMAWTETVVLLDISRGMLRAARHRSPSAIPVCGEAHRLPFAGAAFDAVLCIAADSFLDLHVFAYEARRVLRPGGRLTMTLWADPPREPEDVVRAAAGVFLANGLAVVATETVAWPDDEPSESRRCVIVEAVQRAGWSFDASSGPRGMARQDPDPHLP